MACLNCAALEDDGRFKCQFLECERCAAAILFPPLISFSHCIQGLFLTKKFQSLIGVALVPHCTDGVQDNLDCRAGQTGPWSRPRVQLVRARLQPIGLLAFTNHILVETDQVALVSGVRTKHYFLLFFRVFSLIYYLLIYF